MFSLNLTLCLPHKFAIFPLRFAARISNVGKRGKMLNNLFSNKDKKKNWHLSFMSKPVTNENIFKKIHKPSRRVTVLNALFVRNITDVLSTSDIAPEVLGYGIEITQIKITNDFKIVNVFWQVPISKFDSTVDIQAILSMRAPKIRAELISRNILGKVPKIFFVRDETNLRAAEFERTLQSADVGLEEHQTKITSDADYLENIFSFKSRKQKKHKEIIEKEVVSKIKLASLSLPPNNPSDMNSNLLGLNHETLMGKVVAAKKVIKTEVTPIRVENETNDLFNQIPGTLLKSDTDREKLLKQFAINRKLMMKQRRRQARLHDNDFGIYSRTNSYSDDDDDLEFESDYFDEGINEEEHS